MSTSPVRNSGETLLADHFNEGSRVSETMKKHRSVGYAKTNRGKKYYAPRAVDMRSPLSAEQVRAATNASR
jgi:hypothetical protein